MDFKSVIVVVLVATVASAEQNYQRVSRDAQNGYRRKHHSSALGRSEDLNRRAVKCAKYYANKGKIDHTCSYKNGAGENLWAQWGGDPSNGDAARNSAIAWYAEAKNYNYSKDYQQGTGHFTQMVWRSSKYLGFGVGRKGNMIVGCALYAPAGNVIGNFRKNVIKP